MKIFKGGRQRPADYITICNNIADSYPNGTPHGVQKDAIQNAVDAAKGHGPVNVKFEVVENSKGRFLTITDSNTSGLTGPVLHDVEEYDKELPKDYHWARFEAFAFTKDDPDAIGARGQGKFVFLRASKSYTMYYDTLRKDGIHRLGATQAQRTGCPILPAKDDAPWEGPRAAEQLKAECGLDPLKSVGTRIIVVDPTEEVLQALKNGEFTRAIQETWLRAIEKKQLTTEVSSRDGTQLAELPTPYPLTLKDSSVQKAWVLGKDFKDDEIRVATGERYKVKHFHAVYLNKGTIPEDLQGIAIIQNGMKIVALPANAFPPHVRERVSGFIEFDRTVERELRKGENQDPNHYDLRWRRRLPHAIKEYVNDQLDAFGKAKLGLGTDPREAKSRRRSNAEEWAMRQLQKFASDLDLFGTKGRVRPPPPPPPPSPVKSVGVSINNFAFPDPEVAPRIDWGQSFTGIGVTAYNRTDDSHSIALTFSVLHGDRTTLGLINRERFQLDPKDERSFAPFDILIDQKTFPEAGEYRLTLTLADQKTGDKIDHVSRRFWVQADPSLRKPFELQPVDGFREPNEHRQWLTTGSINNSAELLYNTVHPAYRLAEDEGEDAQGDYLLDIALEGAIQFVLGRPNREDGTADFHPLETGKILGLPKPRDTEEIPSAVHQEIQRFISEVRWRRFEEA